MQFGEIPVADAAGAILAHSLRLGATALKKGRVLSPDDIALIGAAGVERSDQPERLCGVVALRQGAAA